MISGRTKFPYIEPDCQPEDVALLEIKWQPLQSTVPFDL